MIERTDDPVWSPGRDGGFGIAEINRNNRNSGGMGNVNVGFGIADHDSAIRISSGP
jgi:hypothetical protein